MAEPYGPREGRTAARARVSDRLLLDARAFLWSGEGERDLHNLLLLAFSVGYDNGYNDGYDEGYVTAEANA